ncbi:MAG: tripartite tricarboxylate transporter substrate binding protein [Rhodocyclaceae bacterium]|nr:tripartite tricarboxylate transporter substrate binding protein [Rhodocyclaceae bacterium]
MKHAVVSPPAALPLALLCAVGACLHATNASAQPRGPLPGGYPAKPIRMIVPYVPGGPTDILGRSVAQAIGEALGQTVVIDNRPGAAGNVGTVAAARSAPDGYTLNMVAISFAVAPSLDPKVGFDPLRDFAPISLVATVNNMLVVHPSLPVKTVKELIGLARARPGQMTYASGGNGGAQHLAGELFASLAGVKMLHIPYKGSAPGVSALLGGEVMLGFTDTLITLPLVKAGKLRALAVTGPARSPLVPDVPTMAEAGIANYAVNVWFGLLAPAGTPAEIVSRLGAEVGRHVRSAEMRERLTALGAEPVGNTPEQFAAFLKAEIARWAEVVRTARIRAD